MKGSFLLFRERKEVGWLQKVNRTIRKRKYVISSFDSTNKLLKMQANKQDSEAIKRSQLFFLRLHLYNYFFLLLLCLLFFCANQQTNVHYSTLSHLGIAIFISVFLNAFFLHISQITNL